LVSGLCDSPTLTPEPLRGMRDDPSYATPYSAASASRAARSPERTAPSM
jgi:hypothetical protein